MLWNKKRWASVDDNLGRKPAFLDGQNNFSRAMLHVYERQDHHSSSYLSQTLTLALSRQIVSFYDFHTIKLKTAATAMALVRIHPQFLNCM